MNSWIHRIEVAVPDNRYSQQDIGRWMQELAENDRQRRILKALYRSSGIATRHSVIPGLGRDFFGRDGDGRRIEPSTGARNAWYAEAAIPLGIEAGRKLFGEPAAFTPGQVTHVITASCTGFVNPGLDYHLVGALGLNPEVERYHLGFMGCYAAFPALRMADQFCRVNPDAVILVLCLELCSLHLQLGDREDQLLANALFADGAGAALVSARRPVEGATGLHLARFRSALLPEGEQAMAWSVGDRGFDIALSSYVPKLLGANIAQAVGDLLAHAGHTSNEVTTWAVHPGGKSILDQVERALELPPEGIAAPRQVLRDYGNMSSATILFVLQQLLQSPPADLGLICAMAFGPGLTVELALLEQVA